MTITAQERFNTIIKESGIPSDRFAAFIEEITRQVNLNTVLTGTGSPEGAVEASPTQLYMDDSGTAGNILYVKKTGTGSTGWILV